MAVGTLGTTSLAIVLFAFARDAPTALTGSVVAGASWIAVLTSLHVSAQVALPEWVRGLLAYVDVFVPPEDLLSTHRLSGRILIFPVVRRQTALRFVRLSALLRLKDGAGSRCDRREALP